MWKLLKSLLRKKPTSEVQRRFRYEGPEVQHVPPEVQKAAAEYTAAVRGTPEASLRSGESFRAQAKDECARYYADGSAVCIQTLTERERRTADEIRAIERSLGSPPCTGDPSFSEMHSRASCSSAATCCGPEPVEAQHGGKCPRCDSGFLYSALMKRLICSHCMFAIDDGDRHDTL